MRATTMHDQVVGLHVLVPETGLVKMSQGGDEIPDVGDTRAEGLPVKSR